jgi:hypothetical protein
MISKSLDNSTEYLLGKRYYDVLIFTAILIMTVAIAFSKFGVYYYIIVSEDELHRIDTNGNKIALIPPVTTKTLNKYPLRKQQFWDSANTIISKRIEYFNQNKKYKPKTQFVWTVNYSYNSLELDNSKRFIYEANENGKLIYKKQ